MPISAMLLISGSILAADLTTLDQKYSYTLGYRVGNMLKSQGVSGIESEAFAAGMSDYLASIEPKLDKAAQSAALSEMAAQAAKKKEMIADENLKKGEAFLADNAKQAGVVVLDSGLQYKVIASSKADGVSPKKSDKVEVHYEGQLINGKIFDSSVQRGKPAQFSLNGVISGFSEALQLMKPGDKWRVYIPSKLGYGKQGAGANIGPNETLIFDLHLIKIVTP